MDNEFERILAESFNNANNNNVPISTSEANNVNDIFVGNEVKTECIICYEENIPCIKCFQCTAIYCKDCLTKIASDSNKCICSIEIKSNYSKLKKYNQELIKKSREEKKKNSNSTNRNNTTNITNNNNNNNRNNTTNITNNNNNNNNRNNTTTNNNNNNNTNNTNNNRNNRNTNNTNNNRNNRNNSNTNNSNTNNTNSNGNENTNYIPDLDLDLKLEFLKDLTENKIYNIEFKSYKNQVNINMPNFDYFWDYQNKLLTFYPIPNNNQDLKNIVINYNILHAESQAELYVWILQLLNLPFYKFKTSWNNVADTMSKLTNYNKTSIVNSIIHICRCE